MIRLDTTARKLQVVLAGAVTTSQADVIACWSDKTSTAYTGGATPSVTNNTTAVDVLAAPAASTIRDVDYLNFRNKDTASVTVTFRYNDNGTLYEIFKATLLTLECAQFTHSYGWAVLDASGLIKTGVSGPTGATGATGASGSAGVAASIGVILQNQVYGVFNGAFS